MHSIKSISTLLILVLSIVLGAVPASAAQEGQVAYIRLLPQDIVAQMDASGAMEDIQSELAARSAQAFDRLLPVLIEAQQRGVIMDFKPELGLGMVIVQYAPGVQPGAELSGYQTAMDVRVARTAPPRTGKTSYNPRFSIGMYSACISGYGLLAGEDVVVSLSDPTGEVVAGAKFIVDVDGEINGCFTTFAENQARPGYKLTFKVYNKLNGTLRNTFTALVPNLKITAYDKAASVIRFSAVPGKDYSATWTRNNYDSTNSSTHKSVTGTTQSVTSVDFGTVPFRGADSLYVRQSSGRFDFYTSTTVSYIGCRLNSNYCWLSGMAFKPASFEITRAGVVYTVSGRFNEFGNFSGYIFDTQDNPITLKAGDKVSGTGVSPYTLPALAVNLNRDTGVLSGKAPALRYFLLEYGVQLIPNGYFFTTEWIGSNANGWYSLKSANLMNPVDAFRVALYFSDKVNGNKTYLFKAFAP